MEGKESGLQASCVGFSAERVHKREGTVQGGTRLGSRRVGDKDKTEEEQQTATTSLSKQNNNKGEIRLHYKDKNATNSTTKQSRKNTVKTRATTAQWLQEHRPVRVRWTPPTPTPTNAAHQYHPRPNHIDKILRTPMCVGECVCPWQVYVRDHVTGCTFKVWDCNKATQAPSHKQAGNCHVAQQTSCAGEPNAITI